ncbi:MAG: hypothetical protein HQM09_12015 [Candidatus Riflebacteria bacterium]|nr:hypothetical protein [Candidatus Riflebacteria bacterium]
MISTSDVQNIRFNDSDPRQPRSVNLYFDHYKGEPVYRTVVYLANSGCEWSRKTGGCTMCGTKNSASQKAISDDEFFAQLDIVRQYVNKFNASLKSPVKTLHIYNDGFFFNDAEISQKVREVIYDLARSLKMEKLVVETNGLDIIRDNKTNDYLGKAVKLLGDTEFEITLGIESTNPLVRALYSKPDSVEDVKNSMETIRRKGAISKGYVLVKGPLLTEAEAYEDCVNTIRTLQQWSNGKRFRVEFQPVCLLPNTLHEYLMTLDHKDPYYWEPPLLSTLFRILHNFPTMGEDLYSALFAKTDEDSPWEFWQARPHDDRETTYKIYLKLVDYYLYRKFDSIESAFKLFNEELWKERKARVAPHSIEERVGVVKKLITLSRKRNLNLSDYLKTHLRIDGNFIDSCLKHIAQVSPE